MADEKTYEDGYRDGYVAGFPAGYAAGASDGRAQGYSDAKYRAFAAINGSELHGTDKQKVTNALVNVIGRQQ